MSTCKQAASIPGELCEAFQRRFDMTPRLFRAPGRVNLIGEHTDYNDGFVMPCALPLATWVAAAPRDDTRVVVVSCDFRQEREFDLFHDAPQRDWTDYVLGVVAVFRAAGLVTRGVNLMIRGDVPIGAGLSSSASVEVATAMALLAGSHIDLGRVEIARLCQRAENEFVGARCGIMDQFVSANAAAGRALMLDCRTLDYKLLRLPDDVCILICNSMVKHDLAAGEYNVRRAECERGVQLLKARLPFTKALRDISCRELEANKDVLPETIYRRCRHVISENARVLAMAEALERGDVSGLATCLAESHRSLRDDYQVSCPELDLLVDLASAMPGIVASRMTGGGFGGCTVSLVAAAAAEEVRAELASRYRQQTGVKPDTYICRPSDGADEVQ